MIHFLSEMGQGDSPEEIAQTGEAIESAIEGPEPEVSKAPTPPSGSSTSPAPSHIELIRIMNRHIHISPIDRKREIDYTVENTSDKIFNFLYLPLKQFVRNLQIIDEDGSRLNYYPNHVVKDILDEIKKKDKAGYQRFQHRFKHADYKLLIQLPLDRPLGPGELRTVRLSFEADEQVKFGGISEPSWLRGWWGDWERKLFNIPYFAYLGERFPGHEHDEFMVVVGAPGYAATGNRELKGGKPAEQAYKNGLDDNTRVFQTRIPPADDKRYTMNIRYELIPNHLGLMHSLAVYWVLAVITGVVSTGLSLSGYGSGMTQIGQAVSIAFLTVTIGVIFALDMEWADRYQIMSVVPLLLHGIAWVSWRLLPLAQP